MTEWDHKTWVEQQSKVWVQDGIITTEQADLIVRKYDADPKQTLTILPLFASILLGLAILSFIAANWSGISPMGRLVMIVLSIIGLSVLGDYLYQKKRDSHMGISIIGVSLIMFGAGIFLLGQTFHMVADDVRAFLLWAAAGLGLTYLYQSRFLFIVTLAILDVAQIYSLSELNQASWGIVPFTVIGLTWFWWQKKDFLLTWIFAASILFQTELWISAEPFGRGTPYWLPMAALGMFVLGVWLKESWQAAVRWVAIAFVFLYNTFMVMIFNIAYRDEYPSNLYLPVFILFLIIGGLGSTRKHDHTPVHWAFMISSLLLFAPFFYLQQGAAPIMYLSSLLVFSIAVLWQGFERASQRMVNLGILLFLYSTFIAYTRMAWGFLDKSLFFLLGAIILLILNQFLNTQKKARLPKGRS